MEISAYDELAAYTFTRGDTKFIHQHEVNARGASENLNEVTPIRIFFSLAGLYLLIERGYSGRQVQADHAHMARAKLEWPTFVRPTVSPSITVDYVLHYPACEARDKAIVQWCRSVWETWATEHQHIGMETDRLLAGWSPPNP